MVIIYVLAFLRSSIMTVGLLSQLNQSNPRNLSILLLFSASARFFMPTTYTLCRTTKYPLCLSFFLEKSWISPTHLQPSPRNFTFFPSPVPVLVACTSIHEFFYHLKLCLPIIFDAHDPSINETLVLTFVPSTESRDTFNICKTAW